MSEASSRGDDAETAGITVTLGTKMCRERIEQFENLAEENGHTKSSQLRELVEIYLDVHEDQ